MYTHLNYDNGSGLLKSSLNSNSTSILSWSYSSLIQNTED
jgi:hypothetical protein